MQRVNLTALISVIAVLAVVAIMISLGCGKRAVTSGATLMIALMMLVTLFVPRMPARDLRFTSHPSR
jgi:hypothetical protein